MEKYKFKKSGAAFNFTHVIARLQFWAGLEQTGVLDDETKKLFIIPRCGNLNELDDQQMVGAAKRRKKRYYLQGTFWRKKVSDLHMYTDSGISPQVSMQRTDKLIYASLKLRAHN